MAKDKNPLDGVLRFIAEDGFAADLQERLEAHVKATCDDIGVQIEALAEVLEPQIYAMLFTCVVEDLMSRATAGGRNLTDCYLKRHGWKQGSTVKKQLGAVRDSKVGFYIITDLDPGVAITIRNLLKPGDSVAPLAREISRALPVGVPLGARVIYIDGHPSLAGGVLPFEDHMAEEAIAAVGPDDVDLAARISNFWLRKTLEEQRAGGAAAGEPESDY